MYLMLTQWDSKGPRCGWRTTLVLLWTMDDAWATTSSHHGGHSRGSRMRSSHNSRYYPSRRQLKLPLLITSSSRRLIDESTNHGPSSSQNLPLTFLTASRIWQEVVSLPHRILCFSSPSCAPFCGICCCVTCICAS